MTENHRESDVIVFVDDTAESLAVVHAFQKAQIKFTTVVSSVVGPTPAVKTPSGTLRGFNNIRRYFFPEMLAENR